MKTPPSVAELTYGSWTRRTNSARTLRKKGDLTDLPALLEVLRAEAIRKPTVTRSATSLLIGAVSNAILYGAGSFALILLLCSLCLGILLGLDFLLQFLDSRLGLHLYGLGAGNAIGFIVVLVVAYVIPIGILRFLLPSWPRLLSYWRLRWKHPAIGYAVFGLLVIVLLLPGLVFISPCLLFPDDVTSFAWIIWLLLGCTIMARFVLDTFAYYDSASMDLPMRRDQEMFRPLFARHALAAAEQIASPYLYLPRNTYCERCFVRIEPLLDPRIGIRYSRCRLCGFLVVTGNVRTDISHLVLRLDSNWRENEASRNGTVVLNWFRTKKAADFDRVQIVRASDIDVEEFLIAINNDRTRVDERRTKCRCTLSPTAPLSENTRRLLQRAFATVEMGDQGRATATEMA